MISVIITTYRRGPEIVERAINSILNQTYKDIEIIVVDDSPDSFEQRNEVKAAVEGFSKKTNIAIRYVQHKTNLGACAARNTGLRYSKGDYVAYLDDDDEWANDKLEKQIFVFSYRNSKLALVYCSYKIINDRTKEESLSNTLFLEGNVYYDLLRTNFIGGTSMPLLRKEVVEEVGGFDEKQPAAQDYDLWLRIASKYEIAYIPEPLVVYHMQPNECISSNYKKRIVGLSRILEKHEVVIKSNKELDYVFHMKLTRDYACDKQFRNAIKIQCR